MIFDANYSLAQLFLFRYAFKMNKTIVFDMLRKQKKKKKN